MKKYLLTPLFLCMCFCLAHAQPTQFPPADIDYDEFLHLSKTVSDYRQQRLLPLAEFLAMAGREEVMVLDTRSKAAYDQKHLKGAIHLNFSDFSEGKLAALIPDKNTPILIYCNNNITDDPVNFARKSAPLALNIPTFINLYGYGYENLFELADLIPADHETLVFEGLDIRQN